MAILNPRHQFTSPEVLRCLLDVHFFQPTKERTTVLTLCDSPLLELDGVLTLQESEGSRVSKIHLVRDDYFSQVVDI